MIKVEARPSIPTRMIRVEAPPPTLEGACMIKAEVWRSPPEESA
jgi:hypothetical protein